ncbi:SusC/RagA family TonB-linked outer membrane protein [Bacteroides sp. 224]|uniref:SusC/RagA family TonB-linked outer membrane protein n=1 Tax=Bacteroides sp. 224 TaxID=2302936 RepID=UPI0013D0566B|nr:SusC/RagA family TonB-linked outer membrane protein [Bacteroides sp. 224]NDV63651.1 SusC/RagA family TonB-linked outer membrane protein [Bacteroides sp. 224]
MNLTNKVFYVLVVIFLSCSVDMVGQSRKVISGTVTEMFGKTAEPLIGVNVNIVNNQNRSLGGGITNVNGQYNVVVPDDGKELTLVYSYIGMKTKRIKYTGQATLDVTLESEAHSIETVEVTGRRIVRNDLGITEKEMVSATQKVNMEELIAAAPVVSIEEALQGQLGGVDIVLSGDPGSRSAIRIRGTSTLNASAEPLIVIDGVPYPQEISSDFDFATATEEDLGALLNISPNDIATIEVLKDASATAIWGTQGANGVLMIKTKQGTVGKTRFSFSSKWTLKEEPNTIPMLNGKEYTSLMQEAIWNSARYIGLDNTANKYLDKLSTASAIGDNPDWRYYDEYNQNTNWLDYVRQDVLVSDNSFSMNGGGEKATYRFSLGYLSDDGTTIGTSLKRFNTSMTVNYQFSNKLKFGADFSYSQADKEANWADNTRSEALSKMPNKSPFVVDNLTGALTSDYFVYHDPSYEGSFSVKDNYKEAKNYNPVAMVHESMNKSMQREGKITFRGEYEILPGFFYKGWASINMRAIKTRRFLPQVVTGLEQSNIYSNRSDDSYSDQLALQTENKLMYLKNWNEKHNIIATALFRTGQYMNSSYNSVTYGNASSDLSDPVKGTSIGNIGSGESETRNISFVGLLNYTLLDRYIAHASLGIEGNSAMGRNERTGYFPAAGIAWHLQNEPFLAKAKETWLEEAKIRASVGQSGRAPTGASIYLGAYVKGDDYMNMSATKQDRMQLDNLKWETSTEFNVGADVSLFKGRLRFTFDYYQKFINDLLQQNYKLPSTSSFGIMKWFNSGKMENKGWEFRTDVIAFENKDWRVSGYVNFSRNENKITELPGNMSQEPYSPGNGNYAARIIEGQPIGAFYGYRYLGVYQNVEDTYARDAEGNVMNDAQGKPIVTKNLTATAQPGDAKYADINNDGVINQYDIVYLGNSNPTLTGGAGLNIKYKQFSVNAFFHGRFGQSVVNKARMNNEAMYSTSNQSTAVLRRWKNEGDKTDIPRALFGEGYNYLGSDRFVEDVSFIRLKQLTLNYAFSSKICNKLGVNSLSCFVTGYNLFTWSDYTGQDPEVNIPSNPTKLAEDTATTPISRRYTFGINLSF